MEEGTVVDSECSVTARPVNVMVLADTHIPRRARGLPRAVQDALSQADLILHAGDFTGWATLRELERYGRVVAVAGNNDDQELQAHLPDRTVVTVGRFRIGLVHGHGSRGTTFARAAAAFASEAVHCVVFGHSHQPLCFREGDVLFLNPGSPTDRRREPCYSFAWLRASERLEAEMVFFSSKA